MVVVVGTIKSKNLNVLLLLIKLGLQCQLLLEFLQKVEENKMVRRKDGIDFLYPLTPSSLNKNLEDS